MPNRARPGETGANFTAALDGEPSALTPLSGDAKVASAFGKVGRIAGAGVIASISAFRVEPSREYRVRYAVMCLENAPGPVGITIRMGLHWLDAAKAGLSSTVFPDLTGKLVADGRLEHVFNFGMAAGGAIDAVAPPAAVYARPFVQGYAGGVTGVEVIEVSDLSLAVDWSPDLSGLTNSVASLTQRLIDAEARLYALENP